MTAKAAFNAEEWGVVVEAPVLGALRVVAASRGGTIRESIAIAKVYTAARESQGQSELLDELTSSPPAADAKQAAEAGDRLREALRILSEKATPEELDSYKRFVMDVATAAAKAHKEGGFIGIGGKEISAEEQVALDELQGILGA
jgi:predicted outer membrane protein